MGSPPRTVPRRRPDRDGRRRCSPRRPASGSRCLPGRRSWAERRTRERLWRSRSGMLEQLRWQTQPRSRQQAWAGSTMVAKWPVLAGRRPRRLPGSVEGGCMPQPPGLRAGDELPPGVSARIAATGDACPVTVGVVVVMAQPEPGSSRPWGDAVQSLARRLSHGVPCGFAPGRDPLPVRPLDAPRRSAAQSREISDDCSKMRHRCPMQTRAAPNGVMWAIKWSVVGHRVRPSLPSGCPEAPGRSARSGWRRRGDRTGWESP